MRSDTALLFQLLTRWDAQFRMTRRAKWDLWQALRARGQRPKVKAPSRLTGEKVSSQIGYASFSGLPAHNRLAQ